MPKNTQAPPQDWKPTRKWMANVIVGVGSVLTAWATTGAWDTEETVAAIGLFVAAGTTYLLPNE